MTQQVAFEHGDWIENDVFDVTAIEFVG